MLDQETKRRIDTARDILVGKLPNPQAQVEQITIAMIYKFMDDMDKEAMEFGGEASFFTGEFEKYSWTKIFDPKLGGFEMLALYGEAIVKLNQNPSIPQLFRDIFKNAFLPYRDPETLKMFLKIINEFHYDHSEKLGDAFEYLLSVLGSQGDAGQFRTPRHIIDFMVAIIQPKKEESICDPACGTAGFLISSYKHILNENTKKNKGDLLTPDDRKKLINNFTGYDISAEMVRLSLVNLYLHGFTTPKIFEYDTLTSEDRWGDYFDIILANPPFMTPKGGIRPHKKFAMQANRSEVLFVDYIMEHINPTTGRAAIIVPEGIIFQGATAYKALRKLLVDKNFLYGVVSLPAGIFQPYSGVKTSILLLDKSLAKKTNKILFVKIENDGFGLGAQRKELTTSDLPDAVNFIKQYNSALRNGDIASIDFDNLPLSSIAIEKRKIIENDDYNLSADRYREDTIKKHSKFEMVSLEDVFKLSSGKGLTQQNIIKGPYPVYGGNGINGYHNEYFIENPVIVIGRVGAYCGAVQITQPKSWVTDNGLYVTDYLIEINQKYLSYLLSKLELNQFAKVGGQPSISQSTIYERKIPLPPITIQHEIVSKIEQYENIISGAKQVIENYKPQVDINPEWEMVELGFVCDVRDGTHDSPKYQAEGYPLITSKNIKDGGIDFSDVNLISKEDLENINKRSMVDDGDIIMPMIGTIGNPIIIKKDREFAIKNVALIKFYKESKIENSYLNIILSSEYFYNHFINSSSGSTQKFIPLGFIRKLEIPLPSPEEQSLIVSRIEKEKQLVNASKELIQVFEQKIKDEINKLWAE